MKNALPYIFGFGTVLFAFIGLYELDKQDRIFIAENCIKYADTPCISRCVAYKG